MGRFVLSSPGSGGPGASWAQWARGRGVGWSAAKSSREPGGRAWVTGGCGHRGEDFTLLFSGGSVGALAPCANCSSVWPPAPLRKRAFSLPLQNTHEKAATPPRPDTMSRACLRVSERVGGKEPCLLWQHSNVSERCHCALTSRHSKHFLTFLRNKALSQWQGQVRGHPALPAPPPGHPRGAERGPQSGRPDARLCCFSAFSILVSLQVPQGRPQTLTGKLRDPRGSGLAFLI